MKYFRLILSFIFIVYLFASCKKKNEPIQNLATITTSAMKSITNTTVYSGGNISDDGGAVITKRGVCWSTLSNPTITDAHTTNGEGIGKYASNIYGLTANTTYFVRAYATNAVGTAYGNEISFITINTTPHVYVVGEDYTGVGANRYARLWKDGVTINLSSGNDTATANSVFVSQNNDVYVAGEKSKNFSPYAREALLWKNGIVTYLTNANTFSSTAKAVNVSGNDVYVAGKIDSANVYSKVTLWKNGVANTLTKTEFSNIASSIYIDGSDVYVAGKIYYNPVYWKNGVAIYHREGRYNSIYVYDGDVHVVGNSHTDFGSGHVIYNKNKTEIRLVTTNVYSDAKSVFVAGEDVYIAGFIYGQGNLPGNIIWKNNVPAVFLNGVAQSVFVYGTDVYAAGYEHINSTTTAARLWKNGVSIPLPNGGVNSKAFSVFVK